MSEIKFACPYCAQHIACDSDYADMCIVCPGCGKPMMVPILSATNTAHPDLCLVAATPTPRQNFPSRVSALDPWTEEAWEKHLAEMPDDGFGQPLPWLIPVLMLLPLAFLALAAINRISADTARWIEIIAGTVCSGIAAWLTVRKIRGHPIARSIVGALAMLGLMGVQFSLFAFLGCCSSI